jgi:hypothetical protein
MLLLQCIIDLDTCPPVARTTAPLCLTSVFTCLCEMVHNGNLLALQLLTKGIIRRCLKLLESAPDFKRSKELSPSQYSAFLCAGFQFLATVANKGSDTSNVLIKEFVKERVIHRSLAIIMSNGNEADAPELSAVKELINSLCSRVGSALTQLSSWISENSENSEVNRLAMEVCLSCLRHKPYVPSEQCHYQQPLAHEYTGRRPRSKNADKLALAGFAL